MKKYRSIIISLILVIALIFLVPQKDIKQVFFAITSPIVKPFHNSILNIRSFAQSLKNINKLSLENKSLKEEKNTLQAEIINLNELKAENKMLAQELNYKNDNPDKDMILAQIISSNPSSYIQSILIDKGENDGLKKGQAVVSQGFLVGIISEIFSDYSLVQLINNSNIILPVELTGSGVTGLLKSNLEGLYIENIPIDNKISEDENVVTGGLDSVITKGIPVGKVSGIKIYKSQIFQDIKVKSPLDFNDLRYVFVIKSK